MNNSNRKGRELEEALRFIQETILRNDPKFKGIAFSAEPNKIIIVSGVRHEIDLLVRTLPGSQYEAAWLFECKNQQDPVGKDQIMLLAAKVNALGANRGILVANQLTRDAQAQIKLESRLRFVSFTQDFLGSFDDSQLLHVVQKPQSIKIHFKERGVPPVDPPAMIAWKEVKFCLNGKKISFAEFVKPHVDQIGASVREEFQHSPRPNGEYVDGQAVEIRFDPEEFTMDGIDAEYMIIEVRFDITVRRQKVISKFELEGQGRSYSFEPLDNVVPGKRLEVNLVELLDPPKAEHKSE